MALQDGNATGLWIVLFVFSKFPELLDTAAFFYNSFYAVYSASSAVYIMQRSSILAVLPGSRLLLAMFIYLLMIAGVPCAP